MSKTVFKEVRYDLDTLIKFIKLGEVGLPDIQRPFIWKNNKVRDLFDSMYQGYPIGYLLFWQNGLSDDSKVIGIDKKQKPPKLLIVDGQQRLTSLYAILEDIPVVKNNYEPEKIKIAFNPLEEKFEVADAAIRRNKVFLADISVLWGDNSDIFDVVEKYISNLESTRELDDNEKKRIKSSISQLKNLSSFPFTALELSANISEEDVSDVFVRINSKGITLNQADFILTLMSVFWDEGRAQLEEFCRNSRRPEIKGPSPYNHFIHPDPDQLLRVSVALGFKRARLRYVYSILRGKDLETEQFSDELRIKQFEVLKNAQKRVLNIQYWKDFLLVLRQAGFRSTKMITSGNNLLFAYNFYLLGRTEYGVKEFTLRNLIAKWFFMSSLTGRYTGSPESALEFDLASFRDVKSSEEFVRILENKCNMAITDDFWRITLPNELATSSPRSPSLFAYFASLVLLDAKVLFSEQKVSELLDPTIKGNREPIERHHLFPKNYLKTLNITDLRETNQIANFALVEWSDNLDISDKSPAEYLPTYLSRFSKDEIRKMNHWHALPDNWETLSYEDFLSQRRELMAIVIEEGYKMLVEKDTSKSEKEIKQNLAEIIRGGESGIVEFKSTLRVNLHTGQIDSRMELAVLKTIAGFLNLRGGTLFIGVSDDKVSLGVEIDKFPNEDKMNLHLSSLIRDKIGPQFMLYIQPHFEEYDEGRVFVINCSPSKSPVFVKDGNIERFYIRTGSSTSELSLSDTQEFIKQRF